MVKFFESKLRPRFHDSIHYQAMSVRGNKHKRNVIFTHLKSVVDHTNYMSEQFELSKHGPFWTLKIWHERSQKQILCHMLIFLKLHYPTIEIIQKAH